jgi:folate-dependent phosphoribosylglycinamide formyltransferase PurN
MSIAVLASGKGSNLQALLDASERGEIPRIAVVIANLPCQALERAASARCGRRAPIWCALPASCAC